MNIYKKFIEDSNLIREIINEDQSNEDQSKEEFAELLRETENIDILERFYKNNDFDYNIKDSEYIIDLFNKYDHVSFEEFLIYAKTLHPSLKIEMQINESTGKEELSIYQRLYNDYLEFYRETINNHYTIFDTQIILDYSCFRGFERLFDFLLPKIGIRHPLLIFACRGGQLKIVKKLENISNVEINSYEYNDGFIEACQYGKLEIVEYLLSKIKKDTIEDGFVEACQYGKLEIVKYLFSKVDQHTIAGGFVDSCHYNKKEVFNFLINKDIGISTKREGFVKLAINGDLEMAKILYPFTHNRSKNLAFKNACKYDSVDFVKFLLNDDITDDSKKLGFIDTNDIEIFNILYPSVSNDIRVLEQRFIADCENDELEFVKLLFDRFEIDYGVITAAKYSSLNVLDFLIEKGVDVNNIFISACEFNSLEIVGKYIVDIDYETLEYAFTEACNNMHYDIVDFLINEFNKNTALTLASTTSYEAEKYVKNKIEIKK